VSELDFGVSQAYQIPDQLWQEIETILPPLPPKKKSGRPRRSDRTAINAIFYLLRTGGQWDALPRALGAKSTVHDRYQFWVEADVFLKLWQISLKEYDAQIGVAKCRRCHDQSAARSGKKPGQIQLIAARAGSNAACWWKVQVCRFRL
jgi:transposase